MENCIYVSIMTYTANKLHISKINMLE